MFIRKESLKEFIIFYPVTTTIILLNTIVMLYVWIFLDGWSNQFIVYDLGGISQSKFYIGEHWRLISYSFLHLGIYHFLINLLFIGVFSPTIEKTLGTLKFFAFYLVTILLGGMFILFFTNNSGVGASGFVFGLLGFYIVQVIFRKIENTFNKKLIIQFTLSSWILTFIFSLVTQQLVTTFGHLGGFIGGVCLGVLYKKISLDKDYQIQVNTSSNGNSN
ncbi:rhomboid family intramembrane serine protease [Anaerobacillus alkaliphilus]|nr:rhomboid family intramembrane serine protease [Anaerobacillus alkaliphilus]